MGGFRVNRIHLNKARMPCSGRAIRYPDVVEVIQLSYSSLSFTNLQRPTLHVYRDHWVHLIHIKNKHRRTWVAVGEISFLYITVGLTIVLFSFDEIPWKRIFAQKAQPFEPHALKHEKISKKYRNENNRYQSHQALHPYADVYYLYKIKHSMNSMNSVRLPSQISCFWYFQGRLGRIAEWRTILLLLRESSS